MKHFERTIALQKQGKSRAEIMAIVRKGKKPRMIVRRRFSVKVFNAETTFVIQNVSQHRANTLYEKYRNQGYKVSLIETGSSIPAQRGYKKLEFTEKNFIPSLVGRIPFVPSTSEFRQQADRNNREAKRKVFVSRQNNSTINRSELWRIFDKESQVCIFAGENEASMIDFMEANGAFANPYILNEWVLYISEKIYHELMGS